MVASQTVTKMPPALSASSRRDERDEDVVVGDVGEHQRAPRDPEVNAERGLVGAVAHHVADDGADPPVGRLDDVEEVAAEHGAGPAGPVVARAADEVGEQQRPGQQPALEPGVLGGEQPLLAQLDLGDLRLARWTAYRIVRSSSSGVRSSLTR